MTLANVGDALAQVLLQDLHLGSRAVHSRAACGDLGPLYLTD